MDSLEDRIVFDPEILVGKATVRGTRISVEAVLCQLAIDPRPEALFVAFPRLSEDDLKACFAFAAKQVRLNERARKNRRKILGPPAGP